MKFRLNLAMGSRGMKTQSDVIRVLRDIAEELVIDNSEKKNKSEGTITDHEGVIVGSWYLRLDQNADS